MLPIDEKNSLKLKIKNNLCFQIFKQLKDELSPHKLHCMLLHIQAVTSVYWKVSSGEKIRKTTIVFVRKTDRRTSIAFIEFIGPGNTETPNRLACACNL